MMLQRQTHRAYYIDAISPELDDARPRARASGSMICSSESLTIMISAKTEGATTQPSLCMYQLGCTIEMSSTSRSLDAKSFEMSSTSRSLDAKNFEISHIFRDLDTKSFEMLSTSHNLNTKSFKMSNISHNLETSSNYIVRAMRLPWSIVLNCNLLLDYLILGLSTSTAWLQHLLSSAHYLMTNP